MELEAKIAHIESKIKKVDRKRDVLLTLYIVLVTGYFGGISAWGNAQSALCLTLSGVALFFVVVLIRDRENRLRWEHAQRIVRHMRDDPNASREDARESVRINLEHTKGLARSGFLPNRKWVNYYLSGIEFIALNAILVISFLPMFHSLNSAFAGPRATLPPEMVFLLIYLLYSLVINAAASVYLYRVLTKAPWESRLLDGRDTSV